MRNYCNFDAFFLQNNYLRIMKRLFLFAVLLGLLAACTDDTLVPEQLQIPATLPSMPDDISIKWNTGDKVSVFSLTHIDDDSVHGHLQYDHLIFTATGSGTTTYLSGEAPKGADSFVAVYPYDEANEMNGSGFNVIIPEVQSAATAGDLNFPLWAWAIAYKDKLSFNFQPVCTYLSFTLENSDITSVRIGTDGGYIAGIFGSYPDENKISLTEWDYNPLFHDVDVLPPADVFNAGQKYYIIIAPTTLFNVFVTLYQGERATEITAIESTIYPKAGDVIDLGTFKAK